LQRIAYPIIVLDLVRQEAAPMIAQFLLTAMLFAVLLYASMTYRQAPIIGFLVVLAAFLALYFVWVPEHASRLASLVGIGRGVDLVLYTWVVISLIMLLNLHLKLRSQMELITLLARKIAIEDALRSAPQPRQAQEASLSRGG
jgi:small membrane protein